MRKWCDKCGECEATHKYLDTIYGTETEIIVLVCRDCADELYAASAGRDAPLQISRLHDMRSAEEYNRTMDFFFRVL